VDQFCSNLQCGENVDASGMWLMLTTQTLSQSLTQSECGPTYRERIEALLMKSTRNCALTTPITFRGAPCHCS